MTANTAEQQGARSWLSGGRFWLAYGVLAFMLLACRLSYDITRPINGLHSWGFAHRCQFARAHVRYGLGYTRGYWTWAVGDPPLAEPRHYLDHPPLSSIVNGGFMLALGIHDWTLRVARLLLSVIGLGIYLRLLRGLVDDVTAILAAALAVLVPITWYFGFGWYEVILGILAIYCYLATIGELDTPRRAWHLWGLGLALFFAIQMAWDGCFFAFAIGVHYVARCVWRRRRPEWKLLIVISAVALVSTASVIWYLILGRGGNWQSLLEIVKWRTTALASRAAGEAFDWASWLKRVGVLLALNYRWPVLILAGLHILYHAGARISEVVARLAGKQPCSAPRRIPFFWLLLLPAASQILVLKGAVWHHHYWFQAATPLIALAAALALRLVLDLVGKVCRGLAVGAVGLLLVICAVYCAGGASYYFSIVQHPASKIEMLQRLNRDIPPDKPLLSFWDFMLQDHAAKGAHYRPQVAWYLDREVVQARSLEEIEAAAKSGRCNRYLIPAVRSLAPLIRAMAQRYRLADRTEAVRPVPGIALDPSMPLNRGSVGYFVFDLTRPPDPTAWQRSRREPGGASR